MNIIIPIDNNNIIIIVVVPIIRCVYSRIYITYYYIVQVGPIPNVNCSIMEEKHKGEIEKKKK